MADWSSIPCDLVGLIANKLSAIEDYSSFTAVCRPYRSATQAQPWRPEEASQPPWLLLSSGGGNPPTTERGLVSLYRNRHKFFLNLPELHGRRCWGSSHGWIVTLGLDRKVHLFNPVNRRRIALPDAAVDGGDDDEFVRKYYMDRVVLIKRPHSDLVVTADLLAKLRVMRSGHWVDVKFSSRNGTIYDVVCYKTRIYAVGIRGMLFLCSGFDGTDPPTAEEFAPQHRHLFKGCGSSEKFYLVESLGELLLVARFRQRNRTVRFQVYKLDFKTKQWIAIEELGDCALFVGACQSMSLSRADDFNCRRNCIYFTDDNYELMSSRGGGKDMGIYDFGRGTCKSLYKGPGSLSKYSTPTWFIPNFT